MRWIIFVIVAAAILAIFGGTYAVSALLNNRKKPKMKSSAPDDDPKFLRDLAERLAKEAEKDKRDSDDEPNKENPLG